MEGNEGVEENRVSSSEVAQGPSRRVVASVHSQSAGAREGIAVAASQTARANDLARIRRRRGSRCGSAAGNACSRTIGSPGRGFIHLSARLSGSALIETLLQDVFLPLEPGRRRTCSSFGLTALLLPCRRLSTSWPPSKSHACTRRPSFSVK